MRVRQRRREVAELPNAQPAPDPAPDRLVFSRELQRKLAVAIGTLSAVERTAFVLRHFEGVSIDEIARVLGRPNGAARHSVFRAVQKLRRALKPVMGYEQ